MKNAMSILFLMSISTSAFADVVCKGSAEFGEIQITFLKISEKNISLEYVADGKNQSKQYTITEFKKNGTTDKKAQAYFIGATKSGQKDDYNDISLSQYGEYKDGLGSPVAFQHNSRSVFGSVSCKKN